MGRREGGRLAAAQHSHPGSSFCSASVEEGDACSVRLYHAALCSPLKTQEQEEKQRQKNKEKVTEQTKTVKD